MENYRIFNKIKKICHNYYNLSVSKDIATIRYLDLIYLINSHPVQFKKKYSFIRENKNLFVFFLILLLKIFKYFSHIIFGLFKKKYYESESDVKNIDIIFFSHLVNSKHLNIKKDFYFGLMPNLFNHKSMMVLNNETELSNQNLLNNYKRKKKMVFISNNISIKKEFCLFLKIFSDLVKIIVNKPKLNDKESKVFYKHVILNLFDQTTLKNLRLSFQIHDLIKKYKPKKIVYTFEGHCYENTILNCAKSIDNNITCIAYNHSIIFPDQPSLLKPKNKKFYPDIILTSGKNGFDILKKIYSRSKLYKIGNPRHPNAKIKSNKGNICLLLPDGTIEETKKMLKLIPDDVKIKNKIKFLVRFHPGVRFSFQNNINPNIIYSKNSLSDDLKKSSWTLYRGTGAVIHGLYNGLRPIYLSYKKNELSLDPLIDLKNYKKIVNNFDELLKIIDKDINSDFFKSKKKYIKKMSKKSDKYFSKINYNLVKKIIV